MNTCIRRSRPVRLVCLPLHGRNKSMSSLRFDYDTLIRSTPPEIFARFVGDHIRSRTSRAREGSVAACPKKKEPGRRPRITAQFPLEAPRASTSCSMASTDRRGRRALPRETGAGQGSTSIYKISVVDIQSHDETHVTAPFSAAIHLDAAFLPRASTDLGCERP